MRNWVQYLNTGGAQPTEKVNPEIDRLLREMNSMDRKHRRELTEKVDLLLKAALGGGLDLPSKRHVASRLGAILRENSLAFAHPENNSPCSLFVKTSPSVPSGWFYLAPRNPAKGADCHRVHPALGSLDSIEIMYAPRTEPFLNQR